MSTAPVETAIAPRGAQAIDRGVLPTTEVVARVHRIQEVMQTLMKKDVHYGTIPGTPKPTLYKPGAELLLMTFRIAPTPMVEDLSTSDEARYRVTVRGTNQVTGEVVAEMVGECSSNELKYRWRAPVCDEEWQETDPALRREVWKKGSNGAYKKKEIRTSPADVANTILKMATKRGLVAMCLSALAASDIFAQDIEDLAEELRESLVDGGAPPAPKETKQPQRASQTGNGATGKAAPAGQKFAVGTVVKVYDNKAPYAVVLKGSEGREAKFTFFDEKLLDDVKQFAGTSHRVRVGYTTTEKNGATYYNAQSIAIHEEPAAAPAPVTETLTAADVFGGGGRERQPGEDD